MANNFFKGKYSLINPSKYVGDPNKIIARSSWEYRFFKYLDTNSSVIQWASEEKPIPYMNPFDGKQHRYFVDILMKYKTRSGGEKLAMVEIKPWSQTQKPKQPKRQTKSYKEACMTYVINQCKWKAAVGYCMDNNMDFIIATEKGSINVTKSAEFLIEGSVLLKDQKADVTS